MPVLLEHNLPDLQAQLPFSLSSVISSLSPVSTSLIFDIESLISDLLMAVADCDLNVLMSSSSSPRGINIVIARHL